MAGYNRPLDQEQQLPALNGSPQFLGVVVATTTKNNADTAVPFTIPTGAVLLLQPDTACYLKAATASTGTVTTANGVLLAANEKFTVMLATDEAWVACLAVSGTTNLKVWQLR
jgi:hypothetical protein